MSFGLLLAPGQGETGTPGDGGSVDTSTRFVVGLSRAGQALDLTGEWTVLDGVEGLDDPAVTPIMEELPDLHGATDLGVYIGPRQVFLPLLLRCTTGAAWEQARRDLRAVANPLLGLVTVSVVRPDGTTRQITGRASVRVDSWDSTTWSLRGWQRFGLLVDCAQPWWVRTGAASVRWTTTSSVGWFGRDIAALQLAPDATWGVPRTVVVDSDAPTYPTVVITGAAGVVTVASGGRSWQVDCTGLTSPVTVVTDPTRSSITDGAGARQWGRLAAPADLWPLQPGAQQVTVTSSAAVAATTIEMTADGLYLAAVA